LGWILVFLVSLSSRLVAENKLLAIVVFQVFYTARHHKGAKQAWLTPFHVLVADGTTRVTGGLSSGVGHTATPINNHATGMTQTAPPTDLNDPNHHPGVPHDNVQSQHPLANGSQQQV